MDDGAAKLFPDSFRKDLAGNAFSATVFGAVAIALLGSYVTLCDLALRPNADVEGNACDMTDVSHELNNNEVQYEPRTKKVKRVHMSDDSDCDDDTFLSSMSLPSSWRAR